MPRHQTARTDSPVSGGPRGRAGVSLDIVDPAQRLGPASGWLRERALSAIGLLAQSGEARVRVVSDPEMTAAHGKYSNDPTTTDVLTFDLNGDAPGNAADLGYASPRELDVDILVCADEAGRRGGALGHAPERELLLYIIHGVLHCL